MCSFRENWIHRNFSSKRNFDIKLSKIELSSIRNLIQKACLKSSSKIISKCWILAAFPRSDGRKMSTDKLSQGNVIYLEVQVSRDANSSLGSLGARADKFCHSSHLSIVYCRDSNSCLKLLDSRSKKTFVIFQRGRSRNFKKFIKTTGCSFAVHKWQLKLYQFTTQVAPPFSEQYLQEGSWQLTEDLIEDQEIHRKKPTCDRLCMSKPLLIRHSK